MRHTTRRHHRDIGTLAKLHTDISLPLSIVFYLMGWPIIFIFYFASFLSWPIDAYMKVRGKQEEWLS